MIFGFLLLVSLAIRILHSGSGQWDDFKVKFNKTYHSESQEAVRRAIFWDNVDTIALHNLMFRLKMTKFQLGINQFADMTHEEFSSMNTADELDSDRIRQLHENLIDGEMFMPDDNFSLPAAFDWRDHGAVTRVNEQKLCGACYAMAAVAAVEGQLFLKTGNLTELSVQEIVDCGSKYEAGGCKGGVVQGVFSYIADEGGMSSAADYPFKHKREKCQKSESVVAFNLTKYILVRSSDDDEILMRAIAKVGPIVSMMDIKHESFMRYSRGIYNEPRCGQEPSTLNHAALAVGYGTENGVDYWIIKNSFGTTWGESGYMRIARRRGNDCGVTSESYYPLVE